VGGCFDSASGASGDVQTAADQEYGPQDFTGLIEEMRVWSVARSAEQIREVNKFGAADALCLFGAADALCLFGAGCYG
jgi:hypothetical protein